MARAVDMKALPAGPNLPAPFPWWGGKAKAAPLIWALGGPDVQTVVDPFGGSATALIRNPYGQRPRTIYNDLDGLLTNAQRYLAYDPDETAYWADRPTNHLDLIASALSGNNRLSVYQWKRGGGMESTGKRKGVRRQEIIIANGNCLAPGEASDG